MTICSYYFSFESTGNKDIDRILYAIAKAGKCFHHTDQWNEETAYGIFDEKLKGNTPVDWIQNAANDLAKSIKNEN